MFRSIAGFKQAWQAESQITQQLLDLLSDESLHQSIAPGCRTLGKLAWHLVTSIEEMISLTGLKLDILPPEAPVPDSAWVIASTYRELSQSLVRALESQWRDEDLTTEHDMYPGARWARGFTLHALIHHQIHHRGQMTVLMRQAGIKIPGIYGPAREEWEAHGVEPPVV